MNIDNLIIALIIQEGASCDSDHWDVNGRAVGCLQIHEGILIDLKNMCNKTYNMEDMKSFVLSIQACREWLELWGKKYQKKVGKEADYEQLARMWNGGPNGYKKDATLKYWQGVKSKIRDNNE